MSEWRNCKLGDVTTIVDCEHKTAPLVEFSNFISVRTSNISNGKIDFDNSNRVSESTYNDWTKRLKPHAADIVLAREAPVGHVGWIPENKNICLGQRTVLIRTTDSNINSKYLLYYLTSSNVRFDLISQATGSVVEHLNVKNIKDFDITVHSNVAEQRAIASVLSSLDDKIDLLHRQNATLEKMAETLFRQWFVEEAKENWNEVKIKDFDVIVTDFVANGSFASLKENVTLINDGPGFALFIRNTDLKSDFTKKVFVDEHAYNFLNKTKLYGGEVIISSVGDVGSVFRCPKFKIPMTLGNNVVMLKSMFNNFFYLYFKSDYGQSIIYGITSGSVQEKFNKTAFRDITINYPYLEYIEDFEILIEPYFNKIDKNKEQIRTLTTLRDTLLPKLMSGEVRVGE